LQEAFKIAEKASKKHSKGEEQEKEKNGKLVVTFQNLKREKTRLEMHISKEQARISALHEHIEKINTMIGVNEIKLKENRRVRIFKNLLKLLLKSYYSCRAIAPKKQGRLSWRMNVLGCSIFSLTWNGKS
jgi:hypothetical protein